MWADRKLKEDRSMPQKKDDVIIQPNKLKIEPFKKLKFVAPLPKKGK